MNYVAQRPTVFQCCRSPAIACIGSNSELPSAPIDLPAYEPEEPSDLEELDSPGTDDAAWEAFIPDEDERDPQPEPGDFWVEFDLGPQCEAA